MNNYIEQKKKEFNEKFTNKEPDNSERSHRLQSNWFVNNDIPAREVNAFLESTLTDLLAKCKEAVPRELEGESLLRTEVWNMCREQTLDNLSKI